MGILVYWEARQKHTVKGEEMRIYKILDFNLKAKTDMSIFGPIMTVTVTGMCEYEMPKCDKCEVRLPR